MYLSVDRLEEGYAVCEDENGIILNIDLKLLPKGIKEADIIGFRDGRYYIEKSLVEKIKQSNKNLLNKIVNGK